jgi:hypothetical protein
MSHKLKNFFYLIITLRTRYIDFMQTQSSINNYLDQLKIRQIDFE